MFHVIVEREAKDNIRALYRNLRSRDRSSSYPARWFDEIRAAIADLAESAERCGLACEDRFFAETIRQRIHDSCKILFTTRGQNVHVLHIRHQHPDPTDLRS